MSSNNVLDSIWFSYQTAIDCSKITLKSIDTGEFHLMDKTKFLGTTVDEAKKLIEESRKYVDDHVIVSLWAIFERKLIEYLHKETDEKLLQENPSEFSKQVIKKLEDKVEYWRVDEILDLFKTMIDSDLIGNAKQIKKYRDWIAHKNPKKAQPTNVSPQDAYNILSKIISKLE